MKGYPGICRDCVYWPQNGFEAPCCKCVSKEDLVTHKQIYRTEHASFKSKSEAIEAEEEK